MSAAARPDGSPVLDADRWARPAAVIATAALAASVVAAGVRAVADGWYPVGDNALFAIRARDVLTEHHPLIGTSTSASEVVGVHLNNPGPLLFDLYAWSAKIGPGALPLGVAGVALGCLAVMAWCGHRLAGHRGVLLAMFAGSALAWAMGPELLVDPWQPHSLLFPFLALVAATWATCAGVDQALVAVVALGSLVLQTHLSYGPLVAVLSLAAAASVARRAARDPSNRPRAVRLAAGTAGLLLVLWAQPLWEQVTADDQGNLARIAEVPGADRGEAVGLSVAVRVAGALFSPLPRWAPPSFETSFAQRPLLVPLADRFERLPSMPAAVAALAATAVLLAALGVLAHRREAGVVATGSAVAGATLVVAVLTTASLPVGLWGLPPHHVRWLWPAAIAGTTAVVAPLLARRAGVLALGASTLAMAVLALVPTHPEPALGPAGATDLAAPAMRAVADQLGALRGRGPLLLETGPLGIHDQYTVPVLLELDRIGEVRVEDPVLVRQLGPDREATGSETGRVVIRLGPGAGAPGEGWERVAFVPGLSSGERAELRALARRISREVRGDGLRLTTRGRAAAGVLGSPPLEEVVGRDVDPLSVLDAPTLRHVVEVGFVEAPGAQAVLERWAELHRREEGGTVAVWWRPDRSVGGREEDR